MDAVAATAGVSKGTLFFHVRSKAALLHLVFEADMRVRAQPDSALVFIRQVGCFEAVERGGGSRPIRSDFATLERPDEVNGEHMTEPSVYSCRVGGTVRPPPGHRSGVRAAAAGPHTTCSALCVVEHHE